MVFFTGYYAEAATLIRDLRTANYTGKIMLSDAGTGPALFTLLSPAEAEGAYGLTLPLAQFEPRANAWAERYKAAYGKEPGPFTMQAYDAVRLALNAIQRAGSLDRAAVGDAIAATTPGTFSCCPGRPNSTPTGHRSTRLSSCCKSTTAPSSWHHPNAIARCSLPGSYAEFRAWFPDDESCMDCLDLASKDKLTT